MLIYEDGSFNADWGYIKHIDENDVVIKNTNYILLPELMDIYSSLLELRIIDYGKLSDPSDEMGSEICEIIPDNLRTSKGVKKCFQEYIHVPEEKKFNMSEA